MPVSTAPAFKPNQAPVQVAAGVLTSAGPSGPLSFIPVTGAGGLLGTVVLAAGANNDVTPGGAWPSGFNRLDLDPTAGVANVTGVLAGTDGQTVRVRNKAALGGNNITLNNLNAGSLAADQFTGVGDRVLPPQFTLDITYYGGTLNKWVMG